MSDKKTDKNSLLDINIAKEIFNIISDISGVSRFVDPGITDTIKNTVFHREDSVHGIVISRDEHFISVALHINIFYGINIPQLSYDIQSQTKRIIEKHTMDKIKTIDVFFEGIDENGVNND